MRSRATSPRPAARSRSMISSATARRLVTPLALEHSLGTVYNMPPPTQGVVSLLILGILDALEIGGAGPASADYVHLAVEATKRAFAVRDRYVTDPAYMTVKAQDLLAPAAVARARRASVDRGRAAPWGAGTAAGGHGLDGRRGRSRPRGQHDPEPLPRVRQRRGAGGDRHQLAEPRLQLLARSRGAEQPAAGAEAVPHAQSRAGACCNDGRTIVYGTMGGDGQPQTQSAVFTRIAAFGMDPQQAVAAPRWLLGRTWGQTSDSLKLESRFSTGVVADLARRGHEMEVLAEYDEAMGHAGAIVRHANGVLEGGADPRSDGAVAAY